MRNLFKVSIEDTRVKSMTSINNLEQIPHIALVLPLFIMIKLILAGKLLKIDKNVSAQDFFWLHKSTLFPYCRRYFCRRCSFIYQFVNANIKQFFYDVLLWLLYLEMSQMFLSLGLFIRKWTGLVRRASSPRWDDFYSTFIWNLLSQFNQNVCYVARKRLFDQVVFT